MRILRVSILLGLAAAAAACGQKGPLVLPDAQHPRKKMKLPTAPKPPAAPAPAPDAPSGSAQSPAPPQAAPETNTLPDPGPQA